MKQIRVAAAVIRKGNRIFSVQRGYGEYKDWWEFPGGKIEQGESGEEAVCREIAEELGVAVRVLEEIGTSERDYPDFHISLTCYLCELVRGEIELREAEDSAWLEKDTLYSVNWLPADRELIPEIEKRM